MNRKKWGSRALNVAAYRAEALGCEAAVGRALDNVFCERLWRRVKYENIYLNQYDAVRQLHTGLTAYFDFYNHERPHQSLNYRTPAEEHFVL